MLQKSRSKTISKFKYLILVPLMLAMLTYVSCSEDYSGEPQTAPQTVDNGAVIEMKVEDIDNLTEDEQERRNKIVNLLGTEGNAGSLILTDGDNHRRIAVNDMKLPPSSAPGSSSSADVSQNAGVEDIGDVPFAVIEEVPVFPGCESLESNQARKDCMSEKVTQHVNANFNTSLGKELGLEGVNRIYVQFKIAKDGNIQVLGARAPHPTLQEEAERVVNTLPQMTPGKQRGQEVGVLYSLPISFRVGE